jgi:hypothetical protein
MMQELTRASGLGRAEALRCSTLAMLAAEEDEGLDRAAAEHVVKPQHSLEGHREH